MKNKALIMICGVLLLFSACGTQNQGTGEGMGVWPSQVQVDSSVSPAGNKVMLLQLNVPAHRPSSCDQGTFNGAYIGIEFDSPLPGGTNISGNIPEIGHTFSDVLPGDCNDHWQYWMLLPDNWQPGQTVELEIHHSPFNVRAARTDGLVIIANIDAQDDEDPKQTARAIPMRGKVGVLTAAN